MANRFLKSAGGSWSAAATWSATSAAGVDNAGPPTAADDCIAELASGNLTLDTGAVCRSFNETSGTGSYTGTITQSASATWTIGDGTSGAGNVALKFNAAATFTRGASASITFASTNGTAQTITCAGENLPATTFNGIGGSWTLSDAFSASGVLVTLTAGTLTGGALTHTWGQFLSTGSTTRALDLTNTVINGLNVVQPWNIASTGMTFTSTGSTLNVSNVGGTFTSGGLTYNTVNFTAVSGLLAFTGGGTYTNMSVVGVGLLGQFRISNDFTFTGTWTLGGDTVQGADRLQVFTSALGTQRIMTATGGAIVINGDVDFQDITFTGSPSWANAGSAFIGDIGNNGSPIIANITSPLTLFRSGAAGNWSSSNWSLTTGGATGQRMPLPQDTVKVDANATGTIASDALRIGGSIDFTGFVGTFSLSAQRTSYGSLIISSGMTLTGSNSWTLGGRSNYTLTSSGNTFPCQVTVAAPNGTYTLTDAFTDSRANSPALNVSAGTFSDGGFNVSLTNATSSFTSSTSTIINMTGTWTLSSTATNSIWSASGTVNGTGSTIIIATASANTRTFAGNGQTYGTLTYTVAGSTGDLDITGSNSFIGFNFSDVTNARVVQFTSATTTTIPGTGWNVNGTLGKLMTVSAVTSGSAATISFTGRYASSDYLSVKDITATTNPLYAGTNSTDGTGNTNVIFTAPVTGDSGDGGFIERRTGFIYRSVPTIGSGTPQDLWLRYLVTTTGAAVNAEDNLIRIFLRQKGGSGETLSDLWITYLASKGYANGTVHDNMMAFFESGTQT